MSIILPLQNLPFTLKDLKNAIPKEYLHGNFFRSLFYFVFDFSLIFVVGTLIYFSLEQKFYYFLPILSIFQGSMFWSVFVVGHDCGHTSFSTNRKINYLFGLIAHSFILVPYHSWKRSHQKHHQHHANLEKDVGQTPITKKYYRALRHMLSHGDRKRNIFATLHKLCLMFPIYLFYNDHPNYKGKAISHFEFNDVYFKPYEKKRFLISIVGYCVMAFLLLSSIIFSFWFMVFAYIIPWVIYNMAIYLVTYLHHHSEKNPWYYNAGWDYLRGALSTTDYDYGKFGKILDFFHHSIERYHVVHHLFPSIPHYHLKKATEAVIPILGDYYHIEKFTLDTYPRIYKNCRYLNEETVETKAYYFQST